jgi:hypothetical protein
MYILQAGFFDGRAGFHLCILLAQYEHQITLKLDELRKANRSKKKTPPLELLSLPVATAIPLA